MTDTPEASAATSVLVTGASGFLGAHCVVRALDAGHRVRAGVRREARADELRETLHRAGLDPADRLTFAVTDLAADRGWSEAVAGCDAVLHVASPFPSGPVEDPEEVIGPARDGAVRVLRAARDAGARRVVLTSSFAAVGYGHAPTDHIFTERDWTDTEADIAPYIKSKAVAERAAWDFIERDGGGLELSVVNPVGIFGPALGPDLSTSIQLIKALIDGTLANGAPNMAFAVVDVRDVADLHLRALHDPAAAGERFIAAAGDAVTLPQVASAIRAGLGERVPLTPVDVLSDEAVRREAASNPFLAAVVGELGNVRHVSAGKARRLLGWAPRSTDEAVVAAAQSLLDLGLVSDAVQAHPAI